mmetsp:Transcript_2492/g.7359  ORF Transcript_2492/g.7359 Transcript_2492/m.7359 type:complete len:383 (-) Transcript_2492:795-1943(-)
MPYFVDAHQLGQQLGQRRYHRFCVFQCSDGNTKSQHTIGIRLRPHHDVPGPQGSLQRLWLLEVTEQVVRMTGPEDDALALQEAFKSRLRAAVQLRNILSDVLRVCESGVHCNNCQLVHVVWPSHTRQRANVGLSAKKIAQAQRCQAPGLGERSCDEDVSKFFHHVLDAAPLRHEFIVALIHQYRTMWRPSGHFQDLFSRNSRACWIVRVADHHDRSPRCHSSEHLLKRESAFPCKTGAFDVETLCQRCLFVHREGGPRYNSLSACCTAAANDEIDPLIRAVGEHALLCLNCGILSNLALEVPVGGVDNEAAPTFKMSSDRLSDMLWRRCRAFIEVEKQLVLCVSPVQWRLVWCKVYEVRLQHRSLSVIAQEAQCSLVQRGVG